MIDIESLLPEAIAAAYANSDEVRGRMDAAGVKADEIRSVADLARIPILPKDDIIALQQANPPFGGLLAAPEDLVRHIYFSPGPIYEPGVDGDDLHFEIAKIAFEWAGFEAGDIVINSLSYHLVPAGMLVDRALTEMGCTVVPGGVGNSDLQLKMMADLGVNGYVGTPSFLMHLIEKAEENGLDFKQAFKLEKMLGTAEPFPLSLRQTLVEKYGLSAANCYATAELGFLALDTQGQMAIRLLPGPVTQVVDPETGQSVGPGEAGEVVVTNLSHAYPLVRLGTGDMAINVDPKPGQSAQEERAITLVGRSGEAVKVRGMFVHPNQLRFVAAQFPTIKAIQGVVTRPENRDYLTLRLVLDDGGDLPAIEGPLTEGVRNVCRVKVDAVTAVPAGEIPADARGMVDNRDWS